MMNEESTAEGRDTAVPVAPKMRCGTRWFVVLSIISITLFLLFFQLKRSQERGYINENERLITSLFFVLYVFQQEYGAYPNLDTIEQLRSDFKNPDILLGTETSNDFFRQLFVSRYIDTESVFHSHGVGYKRPDNVMNGSEMLKAGECDFSYVVWGSGIELKSKAPLLILPLVSGKMQFDRDKSNTALILHCDSTVGIYKIDSSGRVMIDGKDFFDPSQPYWGGQKPRIAWPE